MKFLLMLAIFLVPAVNGYAEELTTADFAAGYYLEVESAGPIHTLELPLEVYRTVRRPDLGDIRVFNGTGEIVPHGLRGMALEPEAVRQKEDIPFFPLYESTLVAGQADLIMHVVRNTAGTIVNIKEGPQKGAGEPQITGYLLDLSGLTRPTGELEFHWNAGQDSSVFNIRLQRADDFSKQKPASQDCPPVEGKWQRPVVDALRAGVLYSQFRRFGGTQ
jgi:hypothetical protein